MNVPIKLEKQNRKYMNKNGPSNIPMDVRVELVMNTHFARNKSLSLSLSLSFSLSLSLSLSLSRSLALSLALSLSRARSLSLLGRRLSECVRESVCESECECGGTELNLSELNLSQYLSICKHTTHTYTQCGGNGAKPVTEAQSPKFVNFKL